MSFVSFNFLLFVALVVILYYCLPKRFQWGVLLAASYAFYWFAGIDNFIYILFTTVSTYLIARWIEWYAQKRANGQPAGTTPDETRVYRAATLRGKRWMVALALVLNLGVLIFVKYYPYFARSINEQLADSGRAAFLPMVDILLPLGISFFTFQAIGYLIDVYRGKYKAQTNIAKYALFVSFFPQIIQGPIGRYDHLAPQLLAEHKFDGDRLKKAGLLMLWGYFKKMVIADRLSLVLTSLYGHDIFLFHGLQVLVIGLMYGLQIYCDFSGGIDVTRGVARAFGIDMAVNFEQPFFANTMGDFWRRWHISLGQWMRDYVFYTLALSKPFNKLGKKAKKAFGKTIGRVIPSCVIALINFMLIAIWHGPNAKYVLFGLWNGGIVAAGMLTQPFFDSLNKRLHISTESKGYRLFQILRTNLLTTIGRLMGRAEGLRVALIMLGNMFVFDHTGGVVGDWMFCNGVRLPQMIVVIVGVLLVFAVDVLKERGFSFHKAFDKQNVWVQGLFFVVTALLILTFGVYGIMFNSASFLYGRY